MPAFKLNSQDYAELQALTGPEFSLPAIDDPSFIDKTIDAFSQLPTGFTEGYTTIPLGNEPISKAGEIMRGIGHLAGFIGFVPDPGDILAVPTKAALLWGSKGVKSAVAKRVLKKAGKDVVDLNADDLIKKAVDTAGPMGIGQMFGGVLHGRSVPMLASSAVMRTGVAKKLGENGMKLLGKSKLSPQALGIIGQAGRGAAGLGIASAVSEAGVTPWDDRDLSERVNAGLSGLTHGAVAGGAFGLIGNTGIVFSKLLANGKPTSAARVLQGLAGGVFQGAPSSLRGDDLADQAYNWLLGGYFGARSHPWFTEAGSNKARDAVAENRTRLESLLIAGDYGRFAEESGVNAMRNASPEGANIMYRELLDYFHTPKESIAAIMKDPNKHRPIDYDLDADANVRAEIAAKATGVDPRKRPGEDVAERAEKGAVEKTADEMFDDWWASTDPTDPMGNTDMLRSDFKTTLEASERDAIASAFHHRARPRELEGDVGLGVVPDARSSAVSTLFDGLVVAPSKAVFENYFSPLINKVKKFGAPKEISEEFEQAVRKADDLSQGHRGHFDGLLLNIRNIFANPSMYRNLRMKDKQGNKFFDLDPRGIPYWKRAVTDPEYRASLNKTQVKFAEAVNELTDRMGVEFAELNTGATREFEVTRKREDGTTEVLDQGVEAFIGLLNKDPSGGLRRFKGAENALPEVFRDGLYDLAYHGGKGWDAFVNLVVMNNGGKEAPVRDAMEAFRKEVSSSRGASKNTRSAQEIVKLVENIPFYFEHGGREYRIKQTDPVRYLESLVQRVSAELGFQEVFGQNISGTTEKVLQDGSTLKETLSSPDKWRRYNERITEEAEKAGSNPADIASASKSMDMLYDVMHGRPADRSVFEPGSFGYNTARNLRAISGFFESMMLSGAAAANVAESVSGDMPFMFGGKRYFTAAKNIFTQENLKPTLEAIGAIDRTRMSLHVDKYDRLTSLSNMFRNATGRVFLHHQINEMQEFTAASMAQLVAKEWRKGGLDPRRLALDKEFLKASKEWTKEEIDILTNPKSDYETWSALMFRFDRWLPQYMTGTPHSRARISEYANKRWVGDWIKFMSYGRQKANRMVLTTKNVQEAYKEIKKDTPEGWSAALKLAKHPATELFGRTVGGTAMQGAAAAMIISLAFGGTTGLFAQASEAKDQPVEFLLESFLYSSLTGPFAQIARYIADPDDNPIEAFGKATYPGAMIAEVHSFLSGKGKYKDQDIASRAATYLKRVPGAGPMGTIAATVGLSSRDAALEGSMRAYWRWRYDEFPPGQFQTGHMEKEHKKFREHMRKAMHNIRQSKDPRQHILNAVKVKDGEVKGVRQSIRSRRLLHGLNEEQIASLRSRVGEKAFAKLVNYDEILTGWAESI